MSEKKPYVFQAKYGGIKATVWENERTKNGETFFTKSISITKPYKDEEKDKWVEGKSFQFSDIFDIILGLWKVAEWERAKKTPKVSFEKTSEHVPF